MSINRYFHYLLFLIFTLQDNSINNQTYLRFYQYQQTFDKIYIRRINTYKYKIMNKDNPHFIKDKIQNIITTHNNNFMITQSKNTHQVTKILLEIQNAFQAIIKDLIYVNLSQQMPSDAKDPISLLKFIVFAFKELSQSVKKYLQHPFEWNFRNIISEYSNDENKSYLQFVAQKALENYELTNNYNKLVLKHKIINQQLKISENANKKIVEKAYETIDELKSQFKGVVEILKQTQKKLNQVQMINRNIEIQKKKLEIIISDFKKSKKNDAYYLRLEQKHVSVIKKKYNDQVKNIESCYRNWWKNGLIPSSQNSS